MEQVTHASVPRTGMAHTVRHPRKRVKINRAVMEEPAKRKRPATGVNVQWDSPAAIVNSRSTSAPRIPARTVDRVSTRSVVTNVTARPASKA